MNIELLRHQHEFVFDTDHKVVALVTGLGGGKTFAGQAWSIKRAIEDPQTLGMIGANTNEQLRNTILRPMFELLDEMSVKHNYNQNTGVLSIGDASILCRSMENFNTLRGVELGWFYLDEIRDLREEAFLVALGRLRCKKSSRLDARVTTTPNGFDWVYDRFAGEKKPDNFRAVFGTTYDNVHLPKDYIQSLETTYDERFREQEMQGKFVSLTSGRIYYGFDRNLSVEPLEQPRDGDTIYVGMDFNVNPMTAVVALPTQDRVNVVDEFYLTDSNTFRMAAEIRNRYPRCHVVVIPDQTGKARKTAAYSSDHAILQQSGFRVMAERSNPMKADRHNTVNRLFDQRTLVVDPRCKKLIKDLEQEVHGKNPLDVGHINDALGYLCYWYKPLRPQRRRSVQRSF